MRIAYTRPVVTVIARSVFCWLVVSVGCAKTDEPIEVPYGLRILVGICDSNEINLMRDDNKRPDRTTLLPWARGKPIAWDVTVPDTYAESHIGNTATKPGAAARKTAQNKIDKYSNLASTHIFYPFAMRWPLSSHKRLAGVSRLSQKTSGRQHSFSNAFSWLCKEEMRFLSTTPW